MAAKANRKSIRAPIAPNTQIKGLYTRVEVGDQGPFLLWDVSDSGIGLWTASELKIQDKLRLTVAQPYPFVVEALVCWVAPSPDGNGYRCGVEIAAANSDKLRSIYEQFRKLMEDSSIQNS